MREHGEALATLRSAISTGAVQAAALFGFLSALILYLAADGIGIAFESDAVGTSVAFIAPGVGLFAFNKTLMGILNGQRRMREFALAQSLRVMAILLFCISVGIIGADAAYLGLGFTVAEAVLLPLLLVFVRPRWRQMDKETFAWIGRHARFGCKALTNGILAEAYIRIDVIMLGLFLDDVQVGIYSFGSAICRRVVPSTCCGPYRCQSGAGRFDQSQRYAGNGKVYAARFCCTALRSMRSLRVRVC